VGVGCGGMFVWVYVGAWVGGVGVVFMKVALTSWWH
jgi:hypothetical protein